LLLQTGVWNVKGVDFELKFDDKKYADGRAEYLEFEANLHHLISKEKDADKKEELKTIKVLMKHNLQYAKKKLKEIK
jgi:hypothetical protein